jgi:hypothetical protein
VDKQAWKLNSGGVLFVITKNLSQMSNKEKDLLKEKIKKAIKLSSQKLIEKKKSLGQSLVISKDGEIKVIKP